MPESDGHRDHGGIGGSKNKISLLIFFPKNCTWRQFFGKCIFGDFSYITRLVLTVVDQMGRLGPIGPPWSNFDVGTDKYSKCAFHKNMAKSLKIATF